MKKLSLVISLLYGTTLLPGCASTAPESQSWTVEPFQRIQHATNRPDGYYQLGRYYQGLNRLDLAADAYRKALAIDPNFFEAHNGLGTVYASQGQYEQALAEFNSALAKAPGAAHIQNNIGYLKFLEGKYAEAAAAFTQATRLDPTNRKAWNNLGMALAKNGEPVKSNQAFTQAIETAPSARPGADSAPARVASRSEGDPTAATLAVPKNRGVIDYTSANGSESDHAASRGAPPASVDKSARTAALAPPASPQPFAVIEKPNPDAMPVVMVNGAPLSHPEKAATVQPRTPEERPVAVSARIMPAEGIAPRATAEKTGPKTEAAMAAPKRPDLQASPAKAAPAPVTAAAFSHGERHFGLEVSNGNGVSHMAAKVGSLLSSRGLPKASLSNKRPFNQAHTVIQYRKGYRLEAARLSRHLGDIQRPAMVSESRHLSPRTDVKLVLGKDLSGKLARIERADSMKLASR